jgi:hypothetical protein
LVVGVSDFSGFSAGAEGVGGGGTGSDEDEGFVSWLETSLKSVGGLLRSGVPGIGTGGPKSLVPGFFGWGAGGAVYTSSGFFPSGCGSGGAAREPASARASAEGNVPLGSRSLDKRTTPTRHRNEQDTTSPAFVSRVIFPVLTGGTMNDER